MLGSMRRRLLPQRSSLAGWVRTTHPGGIMGGRLSLGHNLDAILQGGGHGVRGRGNQGSLPGGGFLFPQQPSPMTRSPNPFTWHLGLYRIWPLLSSLPLLHSLLAPTNPNSLSLGHIALSHICPALRAVPSALPHAGHSHPSFKVQLKCLFLGSPGLGWAPQFLVPSAQHCSYRKAGGFQSCLPHQTRSP